MTVPDTLPPELAELGELLREDPPRPDPRWARGLDQRAAAGFPRPPRPSLWARLLPARSVLLPAMGAATLVVLLAFVIITSPPGGDDSGSSASSGGGSSASSGDGSGASTASAPRPSSQGESSSDSAGATALQRSSKAAPPVPGGGSPGSDARRRRLQERSASLTLAARPRDIESVADDIVRVTDAAGGFVASSNVSGEGGDFALRVPAARLQKTIADLSRLAHVRGRSQSTRDITAEGVSARGRLREYQKEREGLLRALARATTLNETASIKARLRIVNRSIASARTSLARVTNRARYANVSVTLVADRSAGVAGGDGTWTPGDALHDAGRVLEVAAGVMLIALAVALPIGVIVALGALAARATTRRRRSRALDAV
jgi:hypothetical protein